MKNRLRVSNPPPKPLMIWDGECHFCRHWIERWRVITAGAVDYATYQEAVARFPEVPPEQFQRSVVFIDSSGEVFLAAEAVYRSLQYRSSRKWLSWSYDHVPGFAAISEFAYGIIARNRAVGSAFTRLLWGKDVRPPTYFWTRKWFLRSLGAIYLIAFISLWVQVIGLVGAEGILPVNQFLSAAYSQIGLHALSMFPTLCWFNTSDLFLYFLCGGGVVLSVLLIFEIAPVACLIGLFVFYLSLTIAGQTFLSFQWDILLLEAGFLSIFLAPWTGNAPVSKAAVFLLKLLLFKLLVMSGMVKLTSGDDCWWNLTALDYHYWSQPLPTIFAWWADKHPQWLKHFSVAFCLVVEIIVPLFIWAPRRPRLAAFALIVFLQLAIALTGNYCFFNLLTIALCLLLIDDAALNRKNATVIDCRYNFRGRLSIYGAVATIIVTLPVNGWLIFTAFKPKAQWSRPLTLVYEHIEPFRIANGYGLFRVMTKDRREIILEGSADGINWVPYEFKWKPGDVKRAPSWCAPHQPRLDWQMWFAALGTYDQNRWFVRLTICLLQGNGDVAKLLKSNPFPNTPPRYIRAISYRYRFTTLAEHRQTGAWWKRTELGQYLPTISLQQTR
jgi:predicted DCC family thiol-disulfide oxidoreductase YuxK